jgi:hypothetical protein
LQVTSYLFQGKFYERLVRSDVIRGSSSSCCALQSKAITPDTRASRHHPHSDPSLSLLRRCCVIQGGCYRRNSVQSYIVRMRTSRVVAGLSCPSLSVSTPSNPRNRSRYYRRNFRLSTLASAVLRSAILPESTQSKGPSFWNCQDHRLYPAASRFTGRCVASYPKAISCNAVRWHNGDPVDTSLTSCVSRRPAPSCAAAIQGYSISNESVRSDSGRTDALWSSTWKSKVDTRREFE